MKRCLFILFPLAVYLLSACTHTRHASGLSYNDIFLVSWNEDTVNSYQFAVVKDNKFFYTIAGTDSTPGATGYYSGTFNYSSDTLFLNYKGQQPPGLANYLVREGSGHYFIQFFLNNKKRIFLRIRPSYNGHLGMPVL
jgi:hypothetical protein